MERETPEERLAAWETVAAIAFPNEYELPYTPPRVPSDGKLSKCDRARRDTYNMMSDFVKCGFGLGMLNGKDIKKVMAGRIGAAVRHGLGSSSSDCYDSFVPQEVETTRTDAVTNPEPSIHPKDEFEEETTGFSERFEKVAKNLTAADLAKIEEWRRKIPNAAALKEWLERNYMFQNRKLVCSDEFCEYAFNIIAVQSNWMSYKTKHAMNDIRNAIHWIAIDYMRKANEIKRAEEAEHRKNLESEFETKSIESSGMTSEEIAEMQRLRRRKAEKEAMEKIMRGEL